MSILTGGHRWSAVCIISIGFFAALPALGQVRYVDDDAAPGGNGTSWQSAYRHLQDALAEAAEDVSITEIRVAAGQYRPDQAEVAPITPGDRNATFALRSGLAILGGYAGLPSGTPNHRDVRQYETVLSGDLAANDGPNFTGNAENSLHVVTAPNVDATGRLDGLTISAGNNNTGDGFGAGVYINTGSPVLSGCKIAGNAVNTFGGGVFSFEAVPTLHNCLLAGNKSNLSGAAIQAYASTLLLTHCTFTANQAVLGGAGLDSAGSSATLVSCVLWGNSTPVLGGANITVTHSDVQGGYTGTGNINADPKFLDASGQNYRLKDDSPAVDAAPATALPVDLDGHARSMCTQPDMGAYEYGAADHNCDGTINLADFAAWPDCHTGPNQGPYPNGCQAFDYPADGDVDLQDFAALQHDLKAP